MPTLSRLTLASAAIATLLIAPDLAHGKRCDRVLPIDQRTFDHDTHARHYQDVKGEQLACDGVCHTMSRNQKGWKWKRMEIHKRCSASGCHKRPRQVRRCSSLTGITRRVCATCHTKQKKPAASPDTPRVSAFAMKYAHGTHVQTGSGQQCGACHSGGRSNLPTGRAPTEPGHPYCVSCHKSGNQPSMNQCASCHASATEKPLSVPRPVNAYAMTGAFDHQGHELQRLDKAGERKPRRSTAGTCKNCHSNLASVTRASNLPLPTMRGCYDGCHNGKQSFDALSSTCSRCHKGGGLRPEERPKLAIAATERKRYSHTGHQKAGLALEPCSACHTLDSGFRPLPPTQQKPHGQCVTCHAEDFYKPAPTTCGSCHRDTAPWTAQTAALAGGEALSKADSEFARDRSAGFSHSAHTSAYERSGVKIAESCAQCHSQIFRGGAPSGANVDAHGACASCHGRADKPAAPAMSTCSGCHKLGRAILPTPGEWNVAKKFTHTSHERDPRTQGATTPCTTCHQSAAKANNLANVGRPTMRSCDACHNGKQAFKTTGFGCLRCHDGKKP